MTATLHNYEQIIYADFEFVAKSGEAPDVVCLAWREEPSGQTYRLWRDQLGEDPPYRTDERVLFVCFVGNAELHCHLALGWPLPVNVLDLSAEFRCVTNGRTMPAGKGLLGALAYYGFNDTDCKRKDAMQRRVMQGWPFTVEEREEILRYCVSDVEALYLLLARMLPEIELPVALHRGAFVAASALMEFRGVPIDMEIFPQLADPHAWRYVRDAMVPLIDADYGVYVKGPDGDWHFNLEYFGKYLEREGITWPITEKGKLSTKRKTFEDMAKGSSAARRPAAVAAHPRQDAKDQAGGRSRRPQSHGAVAVQGQDQPHAAEGLAVDLLAGGLAALADQAGAWYGSRLRRLVEHGISDCGQPVE